MAKNIEDKIESLIKKAVEEKGYELYDVQYVKEGTQYYLRIFIEKIGEENISIEDCETVNDIVNPLLDDADLIKDQYYLEVSSTGVEKNIRKLQQYKKALGKEIRVNLFKKDENGNKQIEGILKTVNEDIIVLENSGNIFNINLDNISQAKTIYHW